MTLAERQEITLWKKTELFLRICNAKIEEAIGEGKLKESDIEEANRLIHENNIEIKSLAQAIYHFSTSEAD